MRVKKKSNKPAGSLSFLTFMLLSAMAFVFPQPSVGQSTDSPAAVLLTGHDLADSGRFTRGPSDRPSIVLSSEVLLATASLRPPTLAPHRGNPLSNPGSSPDAADHRWDGVVIGAAILGASGVFLGARLCQLSDSVNKHCVRSAVGLGALGAFAGGIIGGLIGGGIPKSRADSTRSPADSTR